MDKRDISQMEEKPGGSKEKSCIAYLCIAIEDERFNVISRSKGEEK